MFSHPRIQSPPPKFLTQILSITPYMLMLQLLKKYKKNLFFFLFTFVTFFFSIYFLMYFYLLISCIDFVLLLFCFRQISICRRKHCGKTAAQYAQCGHYALFCERCYHQDREKIRMNPSKKLFSGRSCCFVDEASLIGCVSLDRG